jgi:hypothetical protein
MHNVLDYGAFGDGVANDKAAFKAAVAACPAGGVVYVPRTGSHYYIDISGGESDAIVINKPITVKLEGTIQSSVGAIQSNPPTIFAITEKGVSFTGNGTIKGDGTVNATNSGTPTTLPSLVKVTADNFTWTGLTMEKPYKVGIYLYGCYHARITDATFTGGPTAYGSPGTTGYFAIYGKEGGRHIIANCQFFPDVNGGAYVSCIFLSNANYCVIDGNVAFRPYEKLIYGACSYAVISNNVVIGREPAAGAIPGTNQQGTLGPVFRADGLYNKIVGNFSQYGGGAQALGAVGLDVSNNTFLDCGQGGIGIIETGAPQALHYISIVNNVITCGNLSGINVGDGILVRTPNSFGPHRYIRIAGNTVNGFAVADPTANIPGRAPTTTYNVDTHIVKPSGGSNGFFYVPIVSGVSGSGGDPNWPLVPGGTVIDNTVTWQCIDPETTIRAQIRVKALGAGQEVQRAIIAGNNVAGGLRGLYLDRLDNCEIFDNRINAATWGIVEKNGTNNRYAHNVIEGASNLGIETLAASGVTHDYRQGTWMPELTDSQTAPVVATMAGSSANNGKWVRIGRMVVVTFNIATTDLTSLLAGSALRIRGLPFTAGPGAGDNAGAVGAFFSGLNLPTANQSVTISTVNNQKYVEVYRWSAVTGSQAMVKADWTNVGAGRFSLTYFTDDP